MPSEQFIALLLHGLPAGFKRIRHLGLLAPCAKTERPAQARRLLAMPVAIRPAPRRGRPASQLTGVNPHWCGDGFETYIPLSPPPTPPSGMRLSPTGLSAAPCQDVFQPRLGGG